MLITLRAARGVPAGVLPGCIVGALPRPASMKAEAGSGNTAP